MTLNFRSLLDEDHQRDSSSSGTSGKNNTAMAMTLSDLQSTTRNEQDMDCVLDFLDENVK
jgi:hypothetical protein